MSSVGPKCCRTSVYVFKPLIVVLLFGLLVGQTASTLWAGEETPLAPIPQDRVCIEGTVIDPEGNRLGGWIVLATPLTATGDLDSAHALSAVASRVDGLFTLEQGLTVGTWQLSLTMQPGWEAVTASIFRVSVGYGRQTCGQVRFMVQPGVGGNATPATLTSIQRDAGFAPELQAPLREDLAAPVAASGLPGCIEAVQFDASGVDVESSALVGWSIAVEDANGALVDLGLTDEGGRITFDGLAPGAYVVSGELRSGWTATTPARFQVTVAGPECRVVTFFSEKQSDALCLKGRVIHVPDGVGLPGWPMTATVAGHADLLITAVSDGWGLYRFDFEPEAEELAAVTVDVCAERRAAWSFQSNRCRQVTLPTAPAATCTVVDDFEVAYGDDLVEVEAVEPADTTAVAGCRFTHVVQRGEGLFAIGAKYNVSRQAMLDANPEVRQQPQMYVYVGQELCVP